MSQTEKSTNKRNDYNKQYYASHKGQMTDYAKKLYYCKKYGFEIDFIRDMESENVLILGKAIEALKGVINNEETKKLLKSHIYPIILV